MTRPAEIRIEKRIANRAIKDILAAGFTIDVYDGEEWALENSSRPRQIAAAMYSTDEDYLFLRKNGKRTGQWVRLIYGNVCDLISDYTVSLEELLKGADELARKIEEGRA